MNSSVVVYTGSSTHASPRFVLAEHGGCLTDHLLSQWPPLWFRLGCTSALQHLGGIHSGCASSGFAWLIFRVVLIFIDHKDNHDAVLIMGVITNLAVAISIASAFPWVRNTHHKYVCLICYHSKFYSQSGQRFRAASSVHRMVSRISRFRPGFLPV
jgi:hypothetical protein